jgi:hypothetical protein
MNGAAAGRSAAIRSGVERCYGPKGQRLGSIEARQA